MPIPFSPRRLRPVSSKHLLVAVALTLATALSGCVGTDSPSPPGTPNSADETALGHVHGLGVDPGDNTLYVASHFGVFRVTDDGERQRVADRWQDTMGFAVIGPGHFLGSGSHTGSLITTTNRTDWDTNTTQPLYDLAANLNDPTTVYATTDQGVLVSSTDAGEPVEVPRAPTLTGMDWQPDGPLVGVAPDGAVMVTDNPITGDWREVGALDGPVEAVDAIAGRWHAATDTGVYESVDNGETWRLAAAQD